jgi:hypothetical protein
MLRSYFCFIVILFCPFQNFYSESEGFETGAVNNSSENQGESKGGLTATFQYIRSSYKPAFGIGLFQQNFRSKQFAYYMNYQTHLTRRGPFLSDPIDLGQKTKRRFQDIELLNFGINRRIQRNSSLYFGLGFAHVKSILEKDDIGNFNSQSGVFYTSNTDGDKFGFNFNFGALLRRKNHVLEIGYHSFTKRYYFGLGLSL